MAEHARKPMGRRVTGPPPVEVPWDQDRADALRDRLRAAMDGTALVLAVAVGYRTGLFDALAWQPGATAEALATSLGLERSRVVRWLDVLVTAGVVEATKEGGYLLPPEHSAHLTRAAEEDDLAGQAAWILRAAATGPLA